MSKPFDIYIRVSRRGGREHIISPAEQEKDARELARKHNLRIGEVLDDIDESGGTLDRPGLEKALARVESGESGGIIVSLLDRLSRDSEHAHTLVRRIQAAEGRIYAVDAPSDWETPEGELQAGVLFAFATYVRQRARANFEVAKKQAIERGIPVHTRPPVGYRTSSERRLELDPVTAPVIREVFRRRAKGEGPAALGAYLATKGVTTSQGSATWSKESIYNLLRNRVYLGELRYGKDDRYRNPTAHEPIVDLETFEAAQHPRRKRLAAPRSAASPYLLSGIVRCHACRHCLAGTKTSRGIREYRCKRTHAGGICPAPARIRAETLEEAVVDLFWHLTEDLEAEAARDPSGELSRLEEEVERAQESLRDFMSLEIQESIGNKELWAEGLSERQARVNDAMERLSAEREASQLKAALPDRETLRGVWERMSVLERRELLSLRFDCIALDRERRLTAYPAGTAPPDLPRRGFRQTPVLVAFPDAPSGARVLTL